MKRLLLGPLDRIDDQFGLFHDYQKNDIHLQGECNEPEATQGHHTGRNTGILMMVDSKNTSAPLKSSLTVECTFRKAIQRGEFSTVSSFAHENAVFVFNIIEMYVINHTRQEQKCCKLDIHLQHRFYKIDK